MADANKYRCGMEAVLDLLSGKWKFLILYHLRHSRLRFSELRRLIDQVSEKMLSQQLKEMVADGLVRRIDFQTVPPHVEYETTPLGLDLCQTMEPLCKWGDVNMRAIDSLTAKRDR